MSTQHPKVAILGAGSLFFGRKAVWQMVHSPHLNGGTLALVDVDADRLAKMEKLARMVADHNKVKLKIEASTDRKDVLADADFVVLSFADRNAHFRGIDCELSAKYGIRMCSGDTIGPGGVMRTAREYPQIIAACRDIETLCPDAWVINYINPTAVHGIGLRKHFPQLKSFALCDAQWGLRMGYAELAGVPNDDKFVLLTTGPNHFTWVTKAEYDGRDVLPKIVEAIRDKADGDANEQVQGSAKQSKGFQNNSIAAELYDTLGALPTVLGHTKEYVRYYQGLGKAGRDKHDPLMLFEVPDRVARTDACWARVDEYVTGKAPISEFDTEFGPDPATDVIEGMWANLGKRFFINTANNGAVPNMPDDAFLELYCDLSMEGPKPLPHGDLPVGVRGMSQQVLDTHEITADAVHAGSRDLLRRALLVDPLTNSIGDTEALLDDLIEAEADALAPELQPVGVR
ncbi:glycoside hydrolase family 4 [Phycisphaerales bacterium AB-hyl4]|uniref:Glycoside hydrolase family 4 n=1 Tax=Natronomicrosphaera hydrolytica TaxID=3242702 RepID=A0ABV4U7D1_9BACT